jgi:sialate O-acetylesterase
MNNLIVRTIIKTTIGICLLLPVTAFTRPTPAELFADHAVLQRDKPITIWGQASPGEKVTVTFAGVSRSVKADEQGRWKAVLDSLPASAEPRDLVIRGNEGAPVVVHDVLVGEVWLASGQSNMVIPVDYCDDSAKEMAAANFPLIRLFATQRTGALQPQDSVPGDWSVCSPDTVGKYSGVAYFFARDLFQHLHVPIGIVHSAYGGTPCEAWTSRKALDTVPELKAEADEEITQMEKAPAEQAAWPESMKEWEKANGLADDENTGFKNGWAAPDFDDSRWKSVTTGFNLASSLKSKTGGIFWMRKTVEIPENHAGKPFRLSLAYLAEEFDTVYFNGVEVGSTGWKAPLYYSCPRVYSIPGKLVKAGRNVIAVRLVAHTAKGGLYVQGSKMELPVADPRSVDNAWKFFFERQFPELTPEILVARPKLNPAQIQTTATGLFNAMINPLIPYTLRGAIWYQGENNARTVDMAGQYKTLFPLMIADWRTRWGLGDFPFFFVQLANNESPDRTHKDNGWSVLREAQLQTLAKSTNTGMAVIIDIGSEMTIHPHDKQDVGKRLALWARAKIYGEANLVYQSPLYQSYTVEGGKIRVRFNTGGSPLMVGKKDGINPVQPMPDTKLEWFEIAGADGKWAWANAVIDGEDSVVVSSPEVPSPTQVRYAWAENPQRCNLYNEAGLPASSFRTKN